jgi:hypothetical protein
MEEKREIIYSVDVDSSKATKGIKETEDAVNDLGNSVEEVAQRGVTMRESLQIGQAVVGGIAAFKGATALLGIENEKLLKTLTQLLAAQQMMSGLQRLMNVLDSQNIIILKAKVLWMGIVDKVAKLLTISMAAATAGITLLIAAGAGLIAYFQRKKQKTEEARIALEEHNKEIAKHRDEIRKLGIEQHLANLENQIALLKSVGASTREIFEAERSLAVVRATLAVSKRIADEEELARLLRIREQLNKNTEDYKKAQIEVIEQQKIVQQARIDEEKQITALEVLKNTYQVAERKRAAERIAQMKKENDEFIALKKKNNENLITLENGFDRTLKNVRDEQKADELRIEDDHTKTLAYIRLNGLRELAEKEIALREEARQRQLDNFNFTIQQTANLLNAVSSMNEAAMNNQLAMVGDNEEQQEAIRKRHFENQKKINIALATVAMLQSAQQAYLSQFLPIPDPTSLARGVVAAGIAVATGLANIAKIKSTQYNGGLSGSAVPTLRVSNMGMPIDSPVNNSENINPQTTVSTNQNEGMKVYVTSKDIRRALDERSFIEKATLT